MSRRVITAIAFVWVLSLISVVVWAQGRRDAVQAQIRTPGETLGQVITGADIGFQPVAPGEMNDNKKLIGKWMVKINGQWRETEGFIGVRR